MKADPGAPLEDALILRNLADHLLALAKDTEQVTKTVSVLTARLDTTLTPETIQDLQKLDKLYQSLSDLSGLSAALAGPYEHRALALKRLKLNATRALVEPEKTDTAAVQGSVDFF